MLNLLQVYCDLAELDGGGRILVWQHSYMENLPVTKNMEFYSDHYRPCTTQASGYVEKQFASMQIYIIFHLA